MGFLKATRLLHGRLFGLRQSARQLAAIALLCAAWRVSAAQIETRKTIATVPSLRVKPGFRVELVAGQGMVAAPIAMAFDENGRLFVAECPEPPGQGNPFQHLGRIRVLEDTDGDGIFESSSIYAQDLPSPTALTCYNGGLFIAAGPEIIYLKEGVETRKTIFSGFIVTTNAMLGGRGVINNLTWGLDNRIHGGAGGAGGEIAAANVPGGERTELGANDFAFDPTTPTPAIEAGSARSTLCFDNGGRRFVGGLVWPLSLPIFEPRYIERNPFVAAPNSRLAVVSPLATIYPLKLPEPVKPWTVRPPPTRGDTFEAVWFKRARGAVVYRGSAFPPEYLENVFIPDAERRVVHRAVLVEDGLDCVARRPTEEQNTEFLFASDTNFCPAQIVNAPDGALYLADWQSGAESGRIVRIVPANFRPSKPPQLGKAKTIELVTAFTNANGWHRDTAARLLYEKRDAMAVPGLTNMANNSRLPLARLHALHALSGLDALREGQVIVALRDPDSRVRERALLLAETFTGSDAIWEQLRAMVSDPSIRVRLQLAFTLGQFQRPNRTAVLTDLVSPFPGNGWMQAAVLSSLSQGGPQMLVSLGGGSGWRRNPVGLQFLEQLARMVGTQGNSDEARRILDFVEANRNERETAFRILYGLGDGLLHTLSSLELLDPNFRLQKVYEDALGASYDPNLSVDLRVAAIRARGVKPHVDAYKEEDVPPILDGTEAQPLQNATIWLMGHYDGWLSVTNLVNRWSALNPMSRSAVLNEMVSGRWWLRPALAWVANGRVPVSDFNSTQMNVLRTWIEPDLQNWAQRLFGSVPLRRTEVVQRYQAAARMAGNVVQGRQIFSARCVNCHQYGEAGQVFGPDLTEARNWSREQILSSILQPNADVAPRYATHVLAARTGQIRVGIVSNDGTNTVTLRQPGGQAEVWPRSAIASLTRQEWSLMPEGLERGLSVQDMAALLAFLTADRP